jgi:coenzyme F420-reducing hydrogenase beta subunit
MLATKKLCSGCSACYAVCHPLSAISMKEDDEGFKFPVIDELKCRKCGKCEAVCPVLHPKPPREPLGVYAAINKDETIRKQSSSGGMFSLFAQQVIDEGGIVYGAGWGSDWRVIHKAVTEKKDLEDLRGSKYVQSDLGDVFNQIKQQLQDGRKILFSGCPCQVAGLRSYLYETLSRFDNLVCVDLICHGVPSPLAFKAYKDDVETQNGAIDKIDFRDKTFGWRRYSIRFSFFGGKKNVSSVDSDLFLKGFLADIYLRKSCYWCSFRELRSGSDITIADYWNGEQRFPKFNDNKGISCVILNTIKGGQLLAKSSNKAILESSDYGHAKDGNPSLLFSVKQRYSRELFFANMKKHGFSRAIKMVIHRTFLSRILDRLLRFMGLR